MYIAQALEVGTDTKQVATDCITTALDHYQSQSPDSEPALCVAFISPDYDYQIAVTAITDLLPAGTQLVGASTAGEIAQQGPVKQPSISLTLLGGSAFSIATAVGTNLDKDSFAAGKVAAEKLQKAAADTDLRFVMMFADGLKGNGSAVLRGIADVLGDSVPVIGGSAGDNGKFKETHQFRNNEVHNDAVVLVGFTGDIAYSVGVNHGWSIVGAPRIATKVTGTTIQEIDHKPAITLYEEYLGEEEIKNLKEQTLGDVALSYPLGIKDSVTGETMLRAPFNVDDAGAIVCGGEVQEGAEVQLMVGNKQEAVLAARTAAEVAKQGLGNNRPEAAFIFSCHVRNTLYATLEDAKAETDAIQAVIGVDTPMHGFYTYAEQAPLTGTNFNIKSCQPALHNETVVVLLLASPIR